MMKNLVMYNIKTKLKSHLAIIVELVIVMIIGNLLLNQLVPFIYIEKTYNKINLSKLVCYTASDEKPIDYEYYSANITYIGRAKKGFYAENSNVYVQPVSKKYFEMLQYDYSEFRTENIPINIYPAIVVQSLSSNYKIGETYTISTSKNKEPLAFCVIGILKNDYVFIPPSENSITSIIDKHSNTIFVVEDIADIKSFESTNTHMLWIDDENNAKDFVLSLLENDRVITAMCGEDANEYRSSLDLKMMGMPLVFYIIAFVVCFAGLLSHVLLSVIQFKRRYSVYYICGYTIKKCFLIQIITDIFPLFVALAISAVAIFILGHITPAFDITLFIYISNILIILLFYIICEIIGLKQLRDRNIMEFLDRR